MRVGFANMRRHMGRGAAPWWNGLAVAYQPIYADDYSDSLVNLVSPGIYDATTGVSPSWQANRGWIFAGAEYVVCPLSSENFRCVVVACRNYDASAAVNISLGGARSVITERGYSISPKASTSRRYEFGSRLTLSPAMASGAFTVALNGVQIWEYGVKTVATTAGAPQYGLSPYIGGYNDRGSFVLPFWGDVIAIGFGTVQLSDDAVSSMLTRIAAL